MSRDRLGRLLAKVICFGFAALFAYAAWQKGLGLDRFEAELRLQGVLPASLLHIAPKIIVVFEWAVVAVLLVGVFLRRVQAVLAAGLIGLLTSMTLYLVFVAATKGLSLSCGCAGKIELSIANAILRNAVLLLIAVFLCRACKWGSVQRVAE